MKFKASLANPGVIFSMDGDTAFTWSVTHNSHARIRRFKRLQAFAISSSSDTVGIYPLRLVCLDGAHPKALDAIEKSAIPPYLIERCAALEWEEASPTRRERRLISPLSTAAWLSWAQSQVNGASSLMDDLVLILLASNLFEPRTDVVHELSLDFEAWCIQHLPPALAAHACRVYCLSAIPRSAWARKETGLTILGPAIDHDGVDTPSQGTTAELLDVGEDASGMSINFAVLNSVEDILSVPIKSNVDGLIKREWAHSFSNLATRLLSSDTRTAALVAWCAYLCEHGTTTTENPAASTVRKYINTALIKLGNAIAELPESPYDWQLNRLEEMYATLVKLEPLTGRGALQAALASFHEFLVEWFDLEPLTKRLGAQSTNGARVRAEVVWRHELAWCVQAAGRCSDARMGQQAKVILSIAGNAPVRSLELRRLRVSNISFDRDVHGEFAEIEIGRDAHRGRLKTLSGQRRVTLRDPEALQILRSFVDYRCGEGSPTRAFLFGDPSDDTLKYRMAATENYVNTLLKSVTGSRDISLHTLRHTVISDEVKQCWLSCSLADVTSLELVAAVAGHASPATTLPAYSHLYELPLRMFLDLAIASEVKLSNSEWSAVLCMKPNTLTQRAWRAQVTTAQIAWQSLAANLEISLLPRAANPFTQVLPAAPSFKNFGQQSLVVESVVWPLTEWRDGTSDRLIAARMHLTHEVAKDWREELERDLLTWRAQQFPRNFATRNSGQPALSELLHDIGARFDRMHQPKFQRLVSYLHGSTDDENLKRAVQSWRRCAHGIYISLAPPWHARELLELLRAAGVLSTSLRACIQTSTNRTESDLTELQVKQVFKQTFDVDVDLVTRNRHSGRPAAYLLWSSALTACRAGTGNAQRKIDRAQKTGAADEVGGLVAWLVCIHAFLILKRLVT